MISQIYGTNGTLIGDVGNVDFIAHPSYKYKSAPITSAAPLHKTTPITSAAPKKKVAARATAPMAKE